MENKQLQLQPRLQLLADLVPQGARLAEMDVIGIEDDTNENERETMREICVQVVGHYEELK